MIFMMMKFWRTIGPGLITAGAAVGVSHLVQSTRAGAEYSFELLIFIILANVLKFPILELGIRIPYKKGHSILEEYKKMGKGYLNSFYLITALTSVIILGAIAVVTAGIFQFIFSLSFSMTYMAIFLIIGTNLLLFIGGYRILDSLMKYLILFLTMSVMISFLIAIDNFELSKSSFIFNEFSFQDRGDILFLMAFVGWMPLPVDASIWQSIWYEKKQINKNSYLDFHIGYWLTMLLAFFFMGLGAITMFQASSSFSPQAVSFSRQLINMLTLQSNSSMASILISIACLMTMISTLITCNDAYARVLNKFTTFFDYKKSLLLLSIFTSFFIIFFLRSMRSLVDFATIISFVVTPIIGWFNFKAFLRNKSDSTYDQGIYYLYVISIGFFSIFTIYYLYLRLR